MTDTTTRTWEESFVSALSKLDELRRDKTANVKSDKGSYSYNYADLATILGYVRPILAEEGFVITQPVGGVAGEIEVGTVLFHRGGGMWKSPLIAMKVSGTPQQIGSIITYLRRYSLLATLGLATEDDDGKAASAPPPPRRVKAPPRAQTPEDRQRAKFFALCGELGITDKSERHAITNSILGREVGSFNDLAPVEIARLIDVLEARVQDQRDDYREDGY